MPTLSIWLHVSRSERSANGGANIYDKPGNDPPGKATVLNESLMCWRAFFSHWVI